MWDEYRKYEPIFGSWYIKRLIGEGSYGQVYEIERRDFGVYKAALKIISIPRSNSEIEAARGEGMDETSLKSYYRSLVDEIVKEFALMSKLKGTANVVSYEDHLVIPHDDGIGWDVLIRMELLTSIKDYLCSNNITERDVIKMGTDICHALELCQNYNIIHRDIKPENIFISPNGDYKLGDFGVARTVEATMNGMSKKGTFFYMAPEVYRGNAYGVGVDIYSLGMVMYFFLNNKRHPFMPPNPQPIKFNDRENALVSLMKGQPLPRPIHGSDQLWSIVQKACEFRAENRFSSPGEMRAILEQLLLADRAASNRIVLGIEDRSAFGRYLYEDDSSSLPDGPGTAILDFVDRFGSDAPTMEANTVIRRAVSNAVNRSPADVQNTNRRPEPKHAVSPPPKKKKGGFGGKLLAVLIFIFILLVFAVFIIVNALPGSDADETQDPANDIVDNVDPDENDNNQTDSNNSQNNDGDNQSDNPPAATRLTLNANVLNLEIGDKYDLKASVSPNGATVGKLTWSSSDTNVVTVDRNGKIKAVGSGIAGITVTADGLTATCTVNVKAEVTVTGISIASPPYKTEYVVGESLSTDGLAIQIKYSDGSTETVTSGFTVNSDPFTTAGTMQIKISYSGFDVTFEVTVRANEQIPEPDDPEV